MCVPSHLIYSCFDFISGVTVSPSTQFLATIMESSSMNRSLCIQLTYVGAGLERYVNVYLMFNASQDNPFSNMSKLHYIALYISNTLSRQTRMHQIIYFSYFFISCCFYYLNYTNFSNFTFVVVLLRHQVKNRQYVIVICMS